MSLLETVFRESAPAIVTAQREGVKTLYLKNQSLDNHKVHIITDANSHIELPTHEQVALNNNPDVSLTTQGYYRELETCLAPRYTPSNFDLVYMTKELEEAFKLAEISVYRDAMVDKLLSTAVDTSYELYFAYTSDVTARYQTILMKIEVEKFDTSTLNLSDDSIVITRDSFTSEESVKYSRADVLAQSVKLGAYYYLPIHIPASDLSKVFEIVADYDTASQVYSATTKTLSINSTVNNLPDTYEINVPKYATTFQYSNTFVVSELASKVYNGYKYILVKYLVGDRPVEIVLANSNNAAESDSAVIVTPTFGVQGDDSYLVEFSRESDSNLLPDDPTYVELSGVHQRITLDARNVNVVVRYKLSVNTTDKIGVVVQPSTRLTPPVTS